VEACAKVRQRLRCEESGTERAIQKPRFRALNGEIRWMRNAGLRRDAMGSQVVDALDAQVINENGNEARLRIKLVSRIE
jgi:hypothetical protein